MIKQVQKRLKEKGINLIVDLSVQAFLTDEGYDPIYGARPLRRAIMKYLEDTLAEQCLSKTLYPNTKIIVRRKKVEGTLMTYTNELEVEIDFSDVDPNLLDQSQDSDQPVAVLSSTLNEDSNIEFQYHQMILE
jgi:hypothetical protein